MAEVVCKMVNDVLELMMRGRYAHVRQLESTDCGTAALATVALHHRVPIDLRTLNDRVGTNCDGTDFLGLVRAAEQLGFLTRAVRGPFEALPEVPLPAIAHVENETGLGHFVVLHEADLDSVVVADPAAQVERLSKERFCRSWTGCLLILQRDRGAVSAETAPRTAADFLGRVRRMIDFARFAFPLRIRSGGHTAKPLQPTFLPRGIGRGCFADLPLLGKCFHDAPFV